MPYTITRDRLAEELACLNALLESRKISGYNYGPCPEGYTFRVFL